MTEQTVEEENKPEEQESQTGTMTEDQNAFMVRYETEGEQGSGWKGEYFAPLTQVIKDDRGPLPLSEKVSIDPDAFCWYNALMVAFIVDKYCPIVPVEDDWHLHVLPVVEGTRISISFYRVQVNESGQDILKSEHVFTMVLTSQLKGESDKVTQKAGVYITRQVQNLDFRPARLAPTWDDFREILSDGLNAIGVVSNIPPRSDWEEDESELPLSAPDNEVDFNEEFWA